jgi:hypothetical protein
VIKTALVVVLLVSALLPVFLTFAGPIVTVEAATSTAFLGISGFPTCTADIDSAISIMSARGLNFYRMSFTPSWYSSQVAPFRLSYVQYFLAHSSKMVVVDPNHLHPANEAASSSARSHWTTVRNNVFQVLKAFPNNNRVTIELINEYVSSDFYSRMQALVTEIRKAGYTNRIIVNKFAQAWDVIDDPLSRTYQGYHYYFNTWSVSGAISNLKLALSQGIKLICTEIGADYREFTYFSSGTVSELNSFLSQCASMGVGNAVWMNYHGSWSNNWPRYKALTIKFPTVYSPI